MGFRLPSSGKVIFNNGKNDEAVLRDIISEAYNQPDLYGEDRIVYTKMSKNLIIEEATASYKDLWDRYRRFTGREDKHPYVKEYSPKQKARHLVNQTIFDLAEKASEKLNTINLDSPFDDSRYISGIHNLNDKNLGRFELQVKDLEKKEEKVMGA